ncbi:Fanconi anemia group D2 protein [Phlebotomus argentipes]|uniref:Fanconi anemia group D2 protein n=1 Tax=Phlebotomus argentipes TaxID=94469 RepID=UPI002893554A|nr:Fanconi anemia group D2 protein [Phlebotomus argentipes]
MYKSKKYRVGTGTLPNTAKKAKEADHPDTPAPGVLRQRNKSPVEDLDEDMLGSQSSIPSSQPQSQRRYFSQRSNMNLLSQMGAPAAPGSSRIPDTYYEYVLQKSGAKCDHPENYLIDCDHIQFVNKIRTTLQNSADYPTNISKFVRGFKSVVANDNLLSKTLSVCIVSLPNSNGFPQSQESLMKNLLMIDFLQEELISVLLERMQELAQKASGCEMTACILVMSLSQLKFINKSKHGQMVFGKITSILESSPMDVKQIIIRHLDDVIEAKKHSAIIRKLMEMLSEDEDLLNDSTLDAFGNMNLSSVLLDELKERVFQYIDRGAPTSLYPRFTKLLLKYNEENCLPELIANIRSHLKWGKASRKELSESHKNVFSLIKISLMKSSKLSDLWIKSIKSSSTPEDHFPLDFVILVTIMEANDDKSAAIESLMRKKFTEELFTRRFLRDVVLQFPDFVVENLGIFLEIADHLFRSKGKIWEIGKLAFKFAFGIDACNRKVILSRLVGLVCEKTDPEVKTRALMMLSEIRGKYFTELQNNGMQLLMIQENIGDIGLMQYRILMDILCSIAYPMPPSTAPEELVHEIDMLVKKQLANCSISVIRLGIVGAVKTIGQLVWHATEEEAAQGFDANTTIQSVKDFPEGPIQDAAVLFEMMIKVVTSGNCADSLAMCYDELALIFSNRRNASDSKRFPNKKYMNWLSESLVDNFTKYFTIEGMPDCRALEFMQKYCLISEEENASMSINIGQLTIMPPKQLESSITVLCPLFNLLRILQFRLDNGSLETLYGLCGFGVILPEHVGSLEDLDLFDNDYDNSTSLSILDMYFHTANWFRELIGSFASQQVPQIRQQILIRLTELIKIEGHIRRLLKVAPTTYVTPNSTFIATQERYQEHVFKKPAIPRSIAGPSKKAGQKRSADNTTSQLILSGASKTQDTSVSRMRSDQKPLDFAMSYGPRESYRQMDLDIVLLLENQFLTEHNLTEERIGCCIGLQEYKFIVEDLVLKLESFVGLRKTQCHHLQIIISPDALIHDVVAMLPQIQQHFSEIVKEMQGAHEAAEEILESHHLYTINVNSLKTCFATTLRLYATLFSWTGFAENAELLQRGLQVIAESAETDVQLLASAAIQNVLKREKLALEISSALYMVYLVDTLTKIAENREEDQEILTRLHLNFLSKRWYTCTGAIEKGSQFNVFLAELLKGVFRLTDFKQLIKQIEWIQQEIPLLKRRDDTLKTFPGFTKNNFTHLFRALCTSLVDVLNRKLCEKLSDSGNLKMWESVMQVLDSLRGIVKEINLAGNNLVFMKNANTILKLFLQHGIPLVENCLTKRQDQVMNIIKDLQDTTRFCNSLCCTSKLTNHAALAGQIPLVRETLEKLVFHVKRVLTINHCSSAFWVGVLRNKDVHGEVIRRKERPFDDSDSDRTDDILPEDEEMSEMSELAEEDGDSTNFSDASNSRSRLL